MRIHFACFLPFFFCSIQAATAQGCSDAGFCTIGSFHEPDSSSFEINKHRNELDISYTYATHLKNERFNQPQLNYRYIKKSGASFEIRLPFNNARNKATDISNSGIGDVTTTYNDKLRLGKNTVINYSAGLRVSLSHSDKADSKNSSLSLPMYLQNGLGTTDILAVANYSPVKYFSISTGLQVPVIQYNQHKALLTDANNNYVLGDGYRRQPDALLKLTGNYFIKKLMLSGSLLGIFHLANDYYNTATGRFTLNQSKGITLNYSFEAIYPVSKNCRFSLLFAEPFKTRKSIPDGLARSRIINPKISFNF